MHRKKIIISNPLLFHLSPCPSACKVHSPVVVPLVVPAKTHTSAPTLSVHPGSLMLEDLPHEIFKRGWKLLSAFSCLALLPSTTAWLTSSLPLQTTPTSLLKALPMWHRVTPAKSDLPPLAQSEQWAEQSPANTSLSVSFRIYARKPEQARSRRKPRLRPLGLAGGGCDDKRAGTVTGSQIYFVIFFYFYFAVMLLIIMWPFVEPATS